MILEREPCRPRRASAFRLSACVLGGALLLAACDGGPPTAEPTPTLGVIQVQTRAAPPTALSIATPWTAPREPPTRVATDAPTLTPVPTPVVVLPGTTRGCELTRGHELWTIAPDTSPESTGRQVSPELAAAWRAGGFLQVTGAVEAHDPAGRVYVIAAESGLFRLTYVGSPLPIAEGESYSFTVYVARPTDPPLGSALRVERAAGGDGRASGEGEAGAPGESAAAGAAPGGLVFFGLTVRETEGALNRLLDGLSDGVTVRQAPSACPAAEITQCGYELRAAPVQVGVGERLVTALPGEAHSLDGLRLSVHSGHVRRWVADRACPDPTDYVLSIRLESQAP